MESCLPNSFCDLTAVITFRNEGQLLWDTVKDIRRTAGETVAIHLIDDGSNDHFDYPALARHFNCRLNRFDTPRGPAANRNFGVDQAETPYVICLDAHMRFYTDDWAERVVRAIKHDPNALYCTVSRPLNLNAERASGADGYGAALNTDTRDQKGLLVPQWNVLPVGHCPYPRIPLPLGATYAFATKFFQDIGGYVGLKQYGGEEAFAGIKAWLFGGSCRLIHDVTIGHIYRDAEQRPWTNTTSCYTLNRLMLAATLFDDSHCQKFMNTFSTLPDYPQTIHSFHHHEAFFQNIRRFIKERACHSGEYFLALNAAFKESPNLEDYLGLTQELAG
jgi:glycosyltransferase involved in cell wall biosynthesis